MKKLRRNQERPDLRYSHDEKAEVRGGILYRNGCTVQVWWDNSGPETWTLEENTHNLSEAKRNFQEMKERFNND
jgi:hypothetical protein